MTEEYIKYLATLCEGKNLLREHEHYYDPDTGMSYDDEGNRWRGAPNPKYDVSGYWPHTGRNAWWKGGGYGSFRRKPRTPKEIDKNKLYFGREAKTEATLVYFLYQANGLFAGTLKLPAGVEKPEGKSYQNDICALASALCGKELTKFNGYAVNEISPKLRQYFAQERGSRDASDIKKYLEKNLV